MREGKPTGIKRHEVEGSLALWVTYKGRRVQPFHMRDDGRGGVQLKVNPHDGPCLLLYGYFDGDEFMEKDCEPIPCAQIFCGLRLAGVWVYPFRTGAMR